ncbi:MAG TPA: ABC transporter ATP-binding protein [Myxococcota bacterium]|nr:ABC transporter ATP-binding protein [Myxococcota bacterium]
MSAPISGARPGALSNILEEEALGKAVDRRLLARLWRYVAPYRGQVALTLLMVVPMFALELAPAWIVKEGLDRVILEGAPAAASAAPAAPEAGLERWLEPPAGVAPLPWLGALFLAAVVLSAVLQYVHTLLMAATGQAAMRDLRADVFRHLQGLHLGFFDGYPVGRLVTRATSDVDNVAEMFSQGIVALVTDVLKMIGFAVALFLVDARLALATFSVVPLLGGAAWLFRLKVRDAFRTTRVLLARINATIQETVTGMKVVQLFLREERNLRDFARLNGEHRDAWFQSIRYDAALFSVVEFAGGITVAILLWWGSGFATPGVLFVFMQWMRRFFLPLRDLSAKYSVMQSSMASIERIAQLLDRQPEIRDPEPAGSRGAVAAELAAKAPARAAAPRGEVEFEDVWFSYQAQPARPEDWVLRGVSFRVAPGERVAFVGSTGAGKTTVIKLLTRLYEVKRGRILLDGVDVRAMAQRLLRRRVATVLQDVFLFSGTIADNVALDRPDLGPAEVERAARAVEAHPFVARLPEGYATRLRERGSNLSAGQRQLLSFARALAHGADVLVLDEATSSIDTETEAAVQRGIHTLMQGKTALVIAHRLSTIEDVDRIYVLHHGRIVESGPHAALLAAGGLYARLHRLQQAGEGRAPEAPLAAAGT